MTHSTKGIVFVVLAICWLISPSIAMAQTPNRAGLLILHADGRAISSCVHFEEEETTGLKLLQRSSFDLSVDGTSTLGATVCRINQEGCDFPAESCFCQCEGNPCHYWSYWYRDGDEWIYSAVGAADRTVRHGDVNAWVWIESTPTQDPEHSLPDWPFTEFCVVPQPTLAVTPRPTAIPPATPEPVTRTPTSAPTAIITEIPTPEPVTIPEPLTLLLYAAGVAGIGLRAWRIRRGGDR